MKGYAYGLFIGLELQVMGFLQDSPSTDDAKFRLSRMDTKGACIYIYIYICVFPWGLWESGAVKHNHIGEDGLID